jgi:hypothetical protein
MEQTAIASPGLTDKHNVQTYVDPLSKKFSQYIPVNRSTRGCERNTLDAAQLNALQDAAVDVSMKAEVVGIDEQSTNPRHVGLP